MLTAQSWVLYVNYLNLPCVLQSYETDAIPILEKGKLTRSKMVWWPRQAGAGSGFEQQVFVLHRSPSPEPAHGWETVWTSITCGNRTQATQVIFSSLGWLVVAQSLSCVRLLDYGLPGSSVHGISQARRQRWAATFFSRIIPNPETEPRSLYCRWSPAL